MFRRFFGLTLTAPTWSLDDCTEPRFDTSPWCYNLAFDARPDERLADDLHICRPTPPKGPLCKMFGSW